MSFDPSRMLYNCQRCHTDPCSCVFTHKPLDVIRLVCKETGCESVFYTMGELANHHLDRHELPLVIKAEFVRVDSNGVALERKI